MVIPESILSDKRIVRRRRHEPYSICWKSSRLDPEGNPVDRVIGCDWDAPSIGIAILMIGSAAEAALYSHVSPLAGSPTVNWLAVADWVCVGVGRHRDYRENLGRFFAANVGLPPDKPVPQHGDRMANGITSEEWSGILDRLTSRTWDAPMLDFATGTVVRDIREFDPASLLGSPEALKRGTRVNFGCSISTPSLKEARQERTRVTELAHRALVAPPSVAVNGKLCDVTWTLALEDVFRIRAADEDAAGSDASLESIAELLASRYHDFEDDDECGEYYEWIERYLAEMERSWRARRRHVSDAITPGPSGKLHRSTTVALSPVYGGDTIPKGAGFGGFAGATIKRVLRARIDELDRPVLLDGAAATQSAQPSRAEEDERTLNRDDASKPTAEMLQVLVGLELAEVPRVEDLSFWVPTAAGRRVAGTSKAYYRRDTAVKVAEQMLERALAINADRGVLYHIETLLVFGSLVSGSQSVVGDVDVGVMWKPAIDDADDFRRAIKVRTTALNEAAGGRFQWWMCVNLPLREVEQRLRAGSPILQLSTWTDVDSRVRETTARLVLIEHGKLVTEASDMLAHLARPGARA